MPPGLLIDGYRAFLVAQFGRPHCADSGSHFQQIVEQTMLFGEAIRGDRPPIGKEEMTQALFDGEMTVDHYWQITESSRLRQEGQKLGKAPQGDVPQDPASKLEAWRTQLNDFLERLSRWSTADEAPERDYYHQKAVIYEELISALPPGLLSDRAVDSFLQFLTTSEMDGPTPSNGFRAPASWWIASGCSAPIWLQNSSHPIVRRATLY